MGRRVKEKCKDRFVTEGFLLELRSKIHVVIDESFAQHKSENLVGKIKYTIKDNKTMVNHIEIKMLRK